MIVFPEPPSSNRYWRNFRGRTVKSKEAREYQEAVKLIARKQKLRTGEIGLHLKWFRKRRAGDLSNRIKVIEDALQGILYRNDSQIVCILAERHDDPKNPRVEVEILDP